jgi:hypothetical protein
LAEVPEFPGEFARFGGGLRLNAPVSDVRHPQAAMPFSPDGENRVQS